MSNLIHAQHVLRVPGKFPVAANWVYYPHDPHAVVLSIHTDGVLVEWTLDRELLLRGLFSRWCVGVGDVRLHSPSKERLVIDLSSPDGLARLIADWQPAADFLNETYSAVPHASAQESDLSVRQVDAAIARCLGVVG